MVSTASLLGVVNNVVKNVAVVEEDTLGEPEAKPTEDGSMPGLIRKVSIQVAQSQALSSIQQKSYVVPSWCTELDMIRRYRLHLSYVLIVSYI